jgi:hypothetical protein
MQPHTTICSPLNTLSCVLLGENTWSNVCATGSPLVSEAFAALSGVAYVAAADGSSHSLLLLAPSSSMQAARRPSASKVRALHLLHEQRELTKRGAETVLRLLQAISPLAGAVCGRTRQQTCKEDRTSLATSTSSDRHAVQFPQPRQHSP